MLKAVCAGAFALAALNCSAFADDRTGSIGLRSQTVAQSEGVVDQRIGQIKAALRLTAEQERHWPPIESAIRGIIRKSEAYEASAGGMLQRVGARAKAFAVDAVALKRVVAVSQPLLRTLDPEQRREALILARALGLGSFAAAF
jgi:Zn-dependent protease with chaperone function